MTWLEDQEQSRQDEALSRFLIPFGATGFLALSHSEFEEARRRAHELIGSPDKCPAKNIDRMEILDAKGMEARTGVPASWWLEQARLDAVPHLRIGKYVRFELEAVLERLRSDPRHADRVSAIPTGTAAKSGRS